MPVLLRFTFLYSAALFEESLRSVRVGVFAATSHRWTTLLRDRASSFCLGCTTGFSHLVVHTLNPTSSLTRLLRVSSLTLCDTHKDWWRVVSGFSGRNTPFVMFSAQRFSFAAKCGASQGAVGPEIPGRQDWVLPTDTAHDHAVVAEEFRQLSDKTYGKYCGSQCLIEKARKAGAGSPASQN